MTFDLAGWANLALRWLHLTAGIAWIGSSFYFMWLDSHLQAPAEPAEGVAGELWSVHGGGFYRQMKFQAAPPGGLPDELHWFKWEAYTTWISGFLLLALIFYLGADLNLIDRSKLALNAWQAIGLGLLSLVLGWLVYDGLCRSPLGKRGRLCGVVWFLILTAAAWGLTRVFSDLGAVMHLGAIIGTVMAANVFFIIIPNQRKMVAQILAGQAPDPALGKQGKQRSVHNNYMTLPVLFIMISNHYPEVVSAPLNWLWLAGIGAAGVSIRHFFNLKNQGRVRFELLLLGAGVFLLTAALNEAARPKPAETVATPTYAEVRAIIDRHCVMCHSAHPTHKGVPIAPNGAMFDTAYGLRQRAPLIYQRAVATHSMPLGDETHMTDEERAKLGAWIKAGADRRRPLMREVRPDPLTAQAFAPFGEVIEARGPAVPINYGMTERFDALAAIDCTDEGGRPIVSLFRGGPLDPPVLRIFERHPLGSQAFMPLDGEGYLVAVAPAGVFDPRAVRVFRAGPRQGVSYRKGVWHHFLLPLAEGAEFLVIDRAGPGGNCDEVELGPADQLRILP